MKKNLRSLFCILLLIVVMNIETVNAIGTTTNNLTSSEAYNSENPFKGNLWGQCTWYVWGRMYEKMGVKLPNGLGNAKDWYNNAPSEYKSTTLKENQIVVLGTSTYSPTYGHVVFIEKIEGNTAYISEGNYDGSGTVSGYHESTKDISSLQVGANYYGNNGGQVLGYIISPNSISIPSYVPGGNVQDIGTNFNAYIIPKSHQQYMIYASGTELASNVSLRTKSTSKSGLWRFVRQSDGTYTIQNQNSGLYLDVSGTYGNENGLNVYLWTNHGGPKMYWYVYEYNWGYRLVPKSANQYRQAMDVTSANFASGTNIGLWEAETSSNEAQTFVFDRDIYKPSGTVQNLGQEFIAYIKPTTKSNLALYASGSNNGASVTLQNNGTTSSYLWKFIRQSDGSYQIQNQKSGLYLDVSGNGDLNGLNVYLWSHNSGTKSYWFIYEYNGGYRLVPKSAKLNMLAIDVKDGKLNSGQSIQIYQAGDTIKNSNAAQTFNIDIIPSEITNLHVRKQGINAVTIDWDKINEATGYVVYMSTNKNGPYKKVGGINKNNPTFTKGNLMLGQTYYFKVKAYTYINGKYYYGASKALKTIITLPAPNLTKSIVAGNKKATINIDKVNGAVGYEIYASSNKNGPYTKMGTTTSTTFTKTGFKSGKIYYFKVRAIAKSGNTKIYSSYSNLKATKIK